MNSPFAGALAKLDSGQDAVMQVLGDSTGQGLWTASFQDPGRGWVGRLAGGIGADLDVNVDFMGANYPGTTTWPGYTVNFRLHTSTRGDAAPTLRVVNGSMGGAQATHLIGWIGANNLIAYPDPDVIFTACGFNDVTNFANMLNRLTALVTVVRGQCPDAPIVVTTQNRSLGVHPTSKFFNWFSAVTNHYVSNPLNLAPPLQRSTAFENVWCLDTQQAYPVDILSTLLALNDTVGGLHPNGDGYQAQADWMRPILVGDRPDPEEPSEPFVGNSIMKPKIKLAGMYYPVRLRVKVDGEWRRIVPRC